MALGTYDSDRNQERETIPDSLGQIVESLLATIPKTKEHISILVATMLIFSGVKLAPVFAATSTENVADSQEVVNSDKLLQIHALLKSLPADTIPTIIQNSEDGEVFYFIELSTPNHDTYSFGLDQSELDQLSAMTANSTQVDDLKYKIDSLVRNAMSPPVRQNF